MKVFCIIWIVLCARTLAQEVAPRNKTEEQVTPAIKTEVSSVIPTEEKVTQAPASDAVAPATTKSPDTVAKSPPTAIIQDSVAKAPTTTKNPVSVGKASTLATKNGNFMDNVQADDEGATTTAAPSTTEEATTHAPSKPTTKPTHKTTEKPDHNQAAEGMLMNFLNLFLIVSSGWILAQ